MDRGIKMKSKTARYSVPPPGMMLFDSWLLPYAANTLHANDEAKNNFLAVCIPSVGALRQRAD
jgi:hypothetical protein